MKNNFSPDNDSYFSIKKILQLCDTASIKRQTQRNKRRKENLKFKTYTTKSLIYHFVTFIEGDMSIDVCNKKLLS